MGFRFEGTSLLECDTMQICL